MQRFVLVNGFLQSLSLTAVRYRKIVRRQEGLDMWALDI